MPENKEIQIRSDEVQEILSHIPTWMIRWGITLIFGLIIMLVFISWFIKYPDTIEGQVILTTQQPPVKLVSQTNGYLGELYIKNNTAIKKGQIISEITNPTSKKAIGFLHKLDSVISLFLITPAGNHVFSFKKDTSLVFGEIQSEYNTLVKNINEYIFLIEDDYYQKVILHISKQINYNNQLAIITNEQVVLMKQELKNATEKYKTDSSLYAKNYTSKHEFYKNQTELSTKKNEYINLKKSTVQYQITVAQYQQEKDRLIKEHEDKERTLINSIKDNQKNIKNYIESWQQNYTFIAPVNGEITYLKQLSKNQYVTAQTPLFAIVSNNQNYIANITIPTKGYGKVSKGQKVRIKLANYPYQEFGQLIGRVTEIAQIPDEESYQVKIKLPKQLITSYQIKIQYTPEMQGTAEIITKDLRLLERIFNNFRKVFDDF